MGQAFDQAGNVLGEAFGETKRDVFERLTEQHPDAHEMRIKALQEKLDRVEQAGAPPRDRMLQFFSHAHLPDRLAKVSLPFCQLAEEIVATLPSNPERTVALRKLLEAKDCAVRALLYQ